MFKSYFLISVMGLFLPFGAYAQNKSPAPQPKSSSEKPSSQEAKPVSVIIQTSLGEIEAELNPEKAPKTVENFLNYVEKDFYKDLVFHRVIPDFMIQGGGFDKAMKLRPPEAAVKNEAHNGLKNLKGTLAMARTPDPHSASSQFFINLKDNDFLNYKNPAEYGYAVFGKVTQGMDVVEKIGAVQTTNQGPMQNVPVEPVVILSIKKK